MMTAMRLVETHEAADAAIMKAVASFSVLRRRNLPRPDLVTPLEGQSNTLANTHAQTDQGTGLLLPAQSIGGSHHQTRTTGAKRMPERDRATVAVDMLSIVGQSQTARTRQHLRGESFFDFDVVEVVKPHADLG